MDSIGSSNSISVYRTVYESSTKVSKCIATHSVV